MAANNKTVIVDPSPSKFVQQGVIVAIVLIILGLLVFIFASAVAGGVLALLGIVLGGTASLRS